MANFMKKAKSPRPLKPIKAVSEVNLDEKLKIEEEEIKEVEPKEEIKVFNKTEPTVAEEEIETIDQQVEDKTEDVKEDKVEKSEPEPEPKETSEEKPKTKKKSNKKKKKEETVEPKENKESVNLEKAEELMLDTIMPCAEGWAEEKKRVNGMLNKIIITEELDPTSVKSLIADMSATLREIIILATESKVALANLKDIMEEIKVVSSTGANSEERKMNGMYAMKNYEHDDTIIDLTVLFKFYRERQEFYEAAVKEIEINRQMLITFGSVFKLELAKAY